MLGQIIPTTGASCVRNLQDLRHHGHAGGSDVELPQPGGLGRRTARTSLPVTLPRDSLPFHLSVPFPSAPSVLLFAVQQLAWT